MSDLTSPQYLADDNLKLAMYNAMRFLDDVTGMEVELVITYQEANRVVREAIQVLNTNDAADDGVNAEDLAHP